MTKPNYTYVYGIWEENHLFVPIKERLMASFSDAAIAMEQVEILRDQAKNYQEYRLGWIPVYDGLKFTGESDNG